MSGWSFKRKVAKETKSGIWKHQTSSNQRRNSLVRQLMLYHSLLGRHLMSTRTDGTASDACTDPCSLTWYGPLGLTKNFIEQSRLLTRESTKADSSSLFYLVCFVFIIRHNPLIVDIIQYNLSTAAHVKRYFYGEVDTSTKCKVETFSP